ncbi:MAG: endonuclease III domain-containing protein [Planctomycetota bacterium]|jgi:endonuclease-3
MAKKSSKKIKIKACPERSRRVDKAEAAQRVKKIWPIFQKTYPNAKSALNFRNPFQMLISTILSAQCTDARVNIVTSKVFKKYKSIEDWAKADLENIESDIRSTGFYHNKAVSIKNASKEIIERFDGSVPDTMEDLVTQMSSSAMLSAGPPLLVIPTSFASHAGSDFPRTATR